MGAYENTYEIGKPFMTGVIHWPERTVYTVPETGRGHELHLYCPSPSEIFTRAVTDGVGDVAADWAAVPYKRRENVAVRGASGNTARPVADGEAARLSVLVIDATTGLLSGLRRTAFPTGMADLLNAAVRREDARPFHGDHAYQREVVWARSPYPSAKAMLTNAFGSFHLEAPVH